MKLLVVLALVLYAACSSVPIPDYAFHGATIPFQKSMTRVRRVYIDSTFDEADRDSIEGAVYAWNETLSGSIQLVLSTASMTIEEMVDPDAILVMKVDSTCTFIPAIPEGSVLAWTNKVGGNKVWVIRDRLGAWQVKSVMMHEFGHVLGADDRKGPGLMHYLANSHDYRGIDKATVEEVAKWQGLPMSALGYCE